MSKRKVMSVAFTGAVATGFAGFAAAPALAAVTGPWTVTGGGAITATNAGTNTFSDTTTHQKITCPAGDVSAKGSIRNVTSKTTGTSIGFISKFNPGHGGTAHACTGPLGTEFNGSLTGANWHVNAVSQSKTGASVTHGTITGIHVKAKTVAGASCSFSASGTATGTYTNGTGVLSTKSAALTLKVNKGCAPLIATGNKATYTGPITVTNGTGGHPAIKTP
jgi:hypothetical protein